MLLIAIDEAGYGPKLGPLVIVATVWSIPGEDLETAALTTRFAPLRTPRPCGQSTVVVDDSKVVYRPADGLATLHAVVSASLHWCGRTEPTLREILPQLVTEDLQSIAETPWLDVADEPHFLSRSMTSELLRGWRESGVELVDVKARVITAAAFNSACDNGGNKADLLSQASLGLAHRLVETHGHDQTSLSVYCDRHGGRRYYAGILQHVFPDARLQVIAEKTQQSVYRLSYPTSRIEIFFTVKGDTFTPVALSSLHAKYLRERLMASFNAYFAARHREPTPLKPTAGYPVDADRFLAEIQSTMKREKIDHRRIVRSR